MRSISITTATPTLQLHAFSAYMRECVNEYTMIYVAVLCASVCCGVCVGACVYVIVGDGIERRPRFQNNATGGRAGLCI